MVFAVNEYVHIASGSDADAPGDRGLPDDFALRLGALLPTLLTAEGPASRLRDGPPKVDEPNRPDADPENAEADADAAIRDLVASHGMETAPAEPASAPPPPARSADERIAALRERRWADLRAALEDDAAPGDEADEDVPPPPPTPLERVRARDAARDAAFLAPPPPPEPDSAGTFPPAHPAAEPLHDTRPAPRNWDMPDDHRMSPAARIGWNLAVYGAILAIPATLFFTSPFAPADTLRHFAAAAGCTAAGYAGVAPARDGAPGYHAHLDGNANGIACEPTAPRTLRHTGSAAFIRVGDR